MSLRVLSKSSMSSLRRLRQYHEVDEVVDRSREIRVQMAIAHTATMMETVAYRVQDRHRHQGQR